MGMRILSGFYYRKKKKYYLLNRGIHYPAFIYGLINQQREHTERNQKK